MHQGMHKHKVVRETYSIIKDIGQLMVQLPEELNLHSSRSSDFTDFVFRNPDAHHQSHECLASRAIITLINDVTGMVNSHMMNSHMMNKLPGKEIIYQSSDSVGEEHIYPLKFVYHFNPSGFPPHMLMLSVGACIMLLRNLDPHNRHCNRTQYIITHLWYDYRHLTCLLLYLRYIIYWFIVLACSPIHSLCH